MYLIDIFSFIQGNGGDICLLIQTQQSHCRTAVFHGPANSITSTCWRQWLASKFVWFAGCPSGTSSRPGATVCKWAPRPARQLSKWPCTNVQCFLHRVWSSSVVPGSCFARRFSFRANRDFIFCSCAYPLRVCTVLSRFASTYQLCWTLPGCHWYPCSVLASVPIFCFSSCGRTLHRTNYQSRLYPLVVYWFVVFVVTEFTRNTSSPASQLSLTKFVKYPLALALAWLAFVNLVCCGSCHFHSGSLVFALRWFRLHLCSQALFQLPLQCSQASVPWQSMLSILDTLGAWRLS